MITIPLKRLALALSVGGVVALFSTGFIASIDARADVSVREAEGSPVRSVDQLLTGGTSLTVDDMQRISEDFGAESFFVLHDTTTEVVDGAGMGFGVAYGSGAQEASVLSDGIFWFPGGAMLRSVDAESDTGFRKTEIPANTFVFAGVRTLESDLASGGGVTCKDGYYACCGTNVNGQWRAKCIKDGDEPYGGQDYPRECTHGGQNSVHCANGTGATEYVF
ncbi:MAG: hypothetical protein ACNA8P_04435 [Phycisphaerales bacterium]